ncbi:MAG: diguanylate cyclase [Gammaproteobacteria bacterium]|nr:diguanylate cyclase [Gammaproteobacteria bacterium]
MSDIDGQKVKQKPSILVKLNRSMMLALLLLIFLMADVIFYIADNSKTHNAQIQRTIAQGVSHVLDGKLETYQKLVQKFASQNEVKWILSGNNVNEAVLWSQKHKRFLPDVIGLALVDTNSQVMGNMGELRVGQACQEDIAAFTQGSIPHLHDIHNDHPPLIHFDVMTRVLDDDDSVMGVVFASFSTQLIQDALDNMDDIPGLIRVYDQNGRIIASNNMVAQEDWLSTRLPIAHTSWQLELLSPPSGLASDFAAVFILILVTFITLSLTLIYFVRRWIGRLLGELINIRGHLYAVLSRDESYVPKEPRYKETETILPAIYGISGAIQYRQQHLARELETDSLTGLKNRRFLDNHLYEVQGALRPEDINYLVYLDLDHFKECNDRYGHAQGDRVLQTLASCLSRHSRQDDVLVRLGGDEFVAILKGVKEEALKAWYERIADSFNQRQKEQGLCSGLCTISAGAMLLNNELMDIHLLKKKADDALYLAKNTGRGRLVIYTETEAELEHPGQYKEQAKDA